MNVSPVGRNLIHEFEGLRTEAYLDVTGKPTIGYGTTRYADGSAVKLGDTISSQEAEGYLIVECHLLSRSVTALVTVPLNQNQFDALICFCYNVGLKAFASSTMRRLLNEKDYVGAAAEFPKWNMATINGVKQVVKGLTRRRAAERKLFEEKM